MKNFFQKECLLAAAALMFVFSSCSSDPLEIDQLEVKNASIVSAKTETTTTKPRKRGAGSQDDEIGSMRYLLIADAELPSDLDAQVATAGGEVVEVTQGLGTALVRSSAPDFVKKASAIKGIRAVLADGLY